MKDRKKITLGTVISTSIGAIIWLVVAFYHRNLLANTSALALMIACAVAWSLGAIIRVVQYLRQIKREK